MARQIAHPFRGSFRAAIAEAQAAGRLPWEDGSGRISVPVLPLIGMLAGFEFAPIYVTPGVGSEIASVLDLSGNNNTITPVGGNGARPTFGVSAAYNGQFVSTWTGTPGLTRATFTQGVQAQPLTFITVCETNTNTKILYDSAASNLSGCYRYYGNVSGWNIASGVADVAGGTTVTKHAFLDQFQVDATGTDSAYQDNWTTPIASGASGNNTQTGISLGNHVIIADFTGIVAAYYIYAGTLSVMTKTAIARYLNFKFTTAITF